MWITESLFWIIIGLGISIPTTLIILTNIVLSILSGDSYNIDVRKMFLVYLIALTGWAIFITEVI